jgi:hypothetical protein
VVPDADIALLVDPADEPARRTLLEAVQREGWRVAEAGGPATCAVVVWSEGSVASAELAAAAQQYLDRRRLLQILLRIEAPEPFVFHHALPVDPSDLDGSERAVDWFSFRLSDGETILAELARLGALARPREGWNAKIDFHKPWRRVRDVRLVELAAEDGRVIRAWRESGREPLNVYFMTAVGNRWQVLDLSSGQLLDEVEVDEAEVFVLLPEREPWWRRVGRG